MSTDAMSTGHIMTEYPDGDVSHHRKLVEKNNYNTIIDIMTEISSTSAV